MATYDMTALFKSITVSAGDILNFPYTGDKKSFNFPAGTYKLECWGAQGGSPYSGGSYTGGKGGYSYGTLSLNNSTNMYIYSGGEGNNCSSSSSWTLIEGGFNGGGNARSYNYSIVGSGGGASDIRIGQDSLYARVIVAGGGGGTGINNNYAGQCGGGLNGGGRTSGSGNVSATSYSDILATYGSQTSAGDVNCYQSDEVSKSIAASFGVGGFMYANNTSNTSTGGGGGGWYGGGCQNHKGGGGGSGYVYTSSTASNYPSGCLLNSSYYLTNASTIAGNTSFTSPSGSSETGHAGDGYVRVTVVSGGGKISVPKQSITTVKTFTANYTGSPQQVTLKKGQYKLECWGAQGGNRSQSSSTSTVSGSGLGGYSVGTINISANTQCYIYVGGQGGMSTSTGNEKVEGGFNGGGFASHEGTGEPGNGGGGASDIRIGQDSLYARVIVAGGGGGSGEDDETGGYGGGLTAGAGSGNTGLTQASQTTAGQYASFGQGGNAYNGGAGGGGWYGGASRYDVTSYSTGSDSEGGGGGSGYVYTSSTASNYPSGCLLNSSYYLTNAQTIAGNTSFTSPDGGTEAGHAGDGCVKVTAISGGIITGSTYELVEVLDYSYTGTVQQVTLPKGKYKLECWGASGQYTINTPSSDSNSAYYAGAYASGTLVSDKETTLYLCVGETAYGKNTAQKGMFNGGGAKYGSSDDNGIGGGATHISLLPHTVSKDSYYRWVASSDGLNSRILVAGGGGNGRSTNSTMYAGYAPSYTTSQSGYSGGMTSSPSQASGQIGGFGYGGTVTSTGDTASSGGGGWYGGGSPGDSYGGGGSSFAWCSQYASYVPSSWKLDSSTYLTDVNLICAKDSMPSYSTSGATMTGNQKADGHIRITVYKKVSAAEFQIKANNAICTSSAAYIKVNGEWKEVTDRYVKVNGSWVS